ncbi:MAG: hypothetical protein U0169_03760 [Polyangiaceae bacterium]
MSRLPAPFPSDTLREPTVTHPSVPSEARRSAPIDGLEAVYAAGHWLYLREAYDDAACLFRVMIQLAPTEERGWVGLGACHEQLGQPTVALQMYAAASAITDPGVLARIARARLLREMGRTASADDALDDAADVARDRGSESMNRLALRELRAAGRVSPALAEDDFAWNTP